MRKKKHHKSPMAVDQIAKTSLNNKKVTEGLEAIYGGKEQNFSKLERREFKMTRFLLRTMLAMGLLSVCAWGGFFAYQTWNNQIKPSEIIVQLNHQAKSQSGAEEKMTINYQNPRKQPLASVNIDANLPADFKITNLDPAPNNQTDLIWNLGALNGNTSGKIEITGHWLAPVPSEETIQIKTSYKPSNFNADFENVISEKTIIDSSLINLTIDGPTTLSAGESGTFTLKLKNDSNIELPASSVTLAIPTGFFLGEIKPTFTKELPPTWQIDKLPAHGEQTWVIKGSFASGGGGFIPLSGKLSLNTPEQPTLLSTTDHYIDVAAGDIKFSLSLAGQSKSARTAPGTTVPVTLVIENTTGSAITGSSVLLDFQTASHIPIKWSGANYGGGRITADGIVWDNAIIGDIAPGGRKVLTASLPISDVLVAADAHSLDILAHLLRGNSDLRSEPFALYIGETASLEVSINADPTDPTTGTVDITFSPPPQPIDDVLITVPIPNGLTLDHETIVPLGSASLVTSTSEWRWRIGSLPKESTPQHVSFKIHGLPASFNLPATLRAIDTQTFEDIKNSAIISQ